MYVPAHFAIRNPAGLRKIITEHPLGALVALGPCGLEANHVPFEFAADEGPFGTLAAHVARANPVWRQCVAGADVMVIFRGHESYISPNWYPSKHETHRQVPTWNYEAVHVHGRLTVIDDREFVRGVVARLTREHEAAEPHPWTMDDSPAEYIEQMLKAVVGIRVEITRIEGKAKLSQNREPRDRRGAADALVARGTEGLGRAMTDAAREP